MKKITLILALLISAYGVSQNTESGSATVTAHVVSPIGISVDTGLDFGTFTTSTASSTVTVATDGTRSFGDTDMELSSYTTSSAASFTVTLDDSETYGIGLAVETQPKHTDNSTLTLGSLKHSLTGDTGNAATSFSVGGTLTVPASASAGDYSGKVKVTVTYE